MQRNILLVHNAYRIAGGEDTAFKDDLNFREKKGCNVFTYLRSNSEIDEMGLFEKLLLPFSAIFSFKTYREVKALIKEKKIEKVYVHNTWLLISPSVFYACFSCHVPVTLRAHNYRLLCPAATFYRRGHGVCEECVSCGLGCALKHNCYRGNTPETLMMTAGMWVHRLLHTYKRVHISALTDFMKEKLILHPDIDEKNVSVRGNRIYADLSAVNGKKADPYFIFVGRLSEEKGIMTLLEAYKKYTEGGTDNDIKLIVCGEGMLSDKCETFVRDNRIKGVSFTGFISHEEILKDIKGAKAVIVPSLWYEGYPMVIAEAHALGTKVVGSDIGSVASLLDKRNGDVSFAAGDADDLCHKLSDAAFKE